eukprot:5257052-Pleurochrysis_carterae.AAC.1
MAHVFQVSNVHAFERMAHYVLTDDTFPTVLAKCLQRRGGLCQHWHQFRRVFLAELCQRTLTLTEAHM